jgi:hypothetical protein
MGSCESYASISIGSVSRTFDCSLLPLPPDSPPDRVQCFASYDATPSSHTNVNIGRGATQIALSWGGRAGDNGVFPGAFSAVYVSEKDGECVTTVGANVVGGVPVSVDVQWLENDTVYEASASGTALLGEMVSCDGELVESYEITGNFSIHVRSVY